MSEEQCKCPVCGGEGEIVAMFPVYAPDYKGDRKPYIEMDCHFCKGEGVVPPVMIERRKNGRKLREARLKRNMGLRSEAERRGISPSALSYMEQGIAIPVFDEPQQEPSP